MKPQMTFTVVLSLLLSVVLLAACGGGGGTHTAGGSTTSTAFYIQADAREGSRLVALQSTFVSGKFGSSASQGPNPPPSATSYDWADTTHSDGTYEVTGFTYEVPPLLIGAFIATKRGNVLRVLSCRPRP